ncbi:MAG: N-acetyltransferase, partial [Halomonadaceae bacterium]
QAVGFYQKAGFFVTSGAYQDAGMPHHDKGCTAPTQELTHPFQSPQPMNLGQDSTTWPQASPTDLCAMARTLAWQTRRRFWLYDEFLDHERYDDKLLAERLSALARSSPRADVRLLIHDDRLLVRRHHRLIRLLQRLPSRMQLRLVNTSYPCSDSPFILGDDQGVLYRHDFAGHQGFANLAAPGRVRPLDEEFERMWQMARPSLELRQLPL